LTFSLSGRDLFCNSRFVIRSGVLLNFLYGSSGSLFRDFDKVELEVEQPPSESREGEEDSEVNVMLSDSLDKRFNESETTNRKGLYET
jgi:hypothetical protein